MRKEWDELNTSDGQYRIGKFFEADADGSEYYEIACDSNGEDCFEKIIKFLKIDDVSTLNSDSMHQHLARLSNLKNIEEVSNLLDLPDSVLTDELGYIKNWNKDFIKISELLDAPISSRDYVSDLSFKFQDKYRFIINLLESVITLHKNKIVLGTISPQGILFNPDCSSVLFTNVENLILSNERNVMFAKHDMLAAPELYCPIIKNSKASDESDNKILVYATEDSDVFSITILIFMILTGYYPFINNSVKTNALSDSCNTLGFEKEYIFKGKENIPLSQRSIDGYEYCVTADIDNIFTDMFDHGLKNPLLRPTAEKMLNVFKDNMGCLIRCPYCECTAMCSNERSHVCPNCNNSFENFIFLNIYLDVSKINLSDFFNSLGINHLYDLGEYAFLDECGRSESQFLRISSIPVISGKENLLVDRTGEHVSENAEAYARVLMPDEFPGVLFIPQIPIFKLAKVLDLDNQYLYDLNNGRFISLGESIVLNNCFDYKSEAGTGIDVVFKLENNQ